MSTDIQVDDETRAALLLFNERVEATAAQERGAKRVAKAERAKDEAASVVRKLGSDPDAKADAKAEAEATYKAAVDAYNTLKDDPTAGDQQRKKASKPEAADTKPAPSSEADAPKTEVAEAAPAESSSDEEPAPATEAAAESE